MNINGSHCLVEHDVVGSDCQIQQSMSICELLIGKLGSDFASLILINFCLSLDTAYVTLDDVTAYNLLELRRQASTFSTTFFVPKCQFSRPKQGIM